MSRNYISNRESGITRLATHNPFTVTAGLTPAVIEAGVKRGRIERARVAATLAAAGWRAVRGALRAVASSIHASQRRRAARLALSKLEPHLLDDLGIRRDQIRDVVDGMLSAPEARAATDQAQAAAVDTTQPVATPVPQRLAA